MLYFAEDYCQKLFSREIRITFLGFETTSHYVMWVGVQSLSRHWKDHLKNDRRSDQDHRLKLDRRSDQDHPF
jgi:hypothetical protein